MRNNIIIFPKGTDIKKNIYNVNDKLKLQQNLFISI